MKKIREHLPTVLFIVGFIVLLGLVGETPLERKDSTAYVRETMEAAKEDALARAQQDNWQHHIDWAEQYLKAPQIALK